jgi:hypothetical protein
MTEQFNANKKEHGPVPKDISKEFLSMGWQEFKNFLDTQKNEPALSIVIDWKDVPTARRLKAFVEKEGRSATIRATKEQFDQEWNVFSSGVKWEKV